MGGQNKRKDAPTGGTDRQGKKKKHGNEGKWKTPHQQTKGSTPQSNGVVAPGDVGVWVTCARNQEWKAAREVTDLFGEYAEIMYGVKQDADEVEQSGEEDIEAAVQRELDSIKAERGDSATRLFTPVKLNVDCLLFIKTKPPVEPVAFVKRICEDASGSKNMKSRYVNRLTPVAESGKATEQGLLGVARKVLSPWFDLSGKKAGSEPTTAEPHKSDEESKSAAEQPAEGSDEASKDGEGPGDKSAGDPVQDVGGVEVAQSYSFAIRPSVRSNSALKRDIVINQIAALINNERHKVNLKAPDKVILVDVYQNVCGMSVVDGDWEDLKRYNLSELYTLGSK